MMVFIFILLRGLFNSILIPPLQCDLYVFTVLKALSFLFDRIDKLLDFIDKKQ